MHPKTPGGQADGDTMGNGKRAWEDHHDQQLREYHAQELSTRAIGERMGFDFSTVARHARELGLAFDRSRTNAAANAAQIDAKAKRAILAQRFLDEAAHALDRIQEPYVMTLGSKDGPQSITLDKPDAGAHRNFMTTAGIATDKAIALDKHDSDSIGEEAKSMLERLLAVIPDATPAPSETPAQDAVRAAGRGEATA